MHALATDLIAEQRRAARLERENRELRAQVEARENALRSEPGVPALGSLTLLVLDHWGAVRQGGHAALSELALDGFRNASDAMRGKSRTIREAGSTENVSARLSAPRARQKGVRLGV